jgi:Ca-activated chloride channel family protein
MANCTHLVRLKHQGICHEPGQDHRNHNHRDSQPPAFRSFFRLAERLVLSYIVLVGLLVSLCLSATGRVLAQDPSDDDVVRVNTDLLLYPIRIRDRKGQAVAGLTEQDLTLKDDEKVTTGIYFAPGADRVAMLFALDQSGSLRQIISQQRDAALALFSRFSDRSSVAVLRFSETSSLALPFTRDAEAARSAFRFSAGPNTRTAIFDAAADALKAFDDLPPVRAERRIVVLISDGLDNRSGTSPDSIIDAALEQRVSFYVIHLPLFEPRDGRLEVRRPAKGFRDIAEKTGGKYFLVGDAKSALMPRENDLTPIFNAIEEDLKSQYLLGFYIAETARDNRQHVFSVSLKPEGLRYSLGRLGFSRTHKFMINLKSSNEKN